MISKKCKYAIKAIQYIAKNESQGKPIFASEIAEQEGIPKKFLESILLDLRNNGILASRRGKHGGYILLKKPADINFTDIIRIMDGPIAMLPCVSLNYYSPCFECKDEETCAIKVVFEKVRDCTLEVLTKSTFDKMID
jgi:Rrf2 family protein